MFGKEKTYKEIEASRNRRLWVTEVALPVAAGIGMLASNDKFRGFVSNKLSQGKTWVRNKKHEYKMRKYAVIQRKDEE